MRTCEHFDIEELVSPEVFKKYGVKAWMFFDPRLLITIDWIRKELGLPMIINNWVWGGPFTQRGLRENTSRIVAEKTEAGKIYLSGHVLAMAVDFDVEGMEAEDVRQWLVERQYDLPFPIRLETGVSWCHLDVMGTGVKVYLFKP